MYMLSLTKVFASSRFQLTISCLKARLCDPGSTLVLRSVRAEMCHAQLGQLGQLGQLRLELGRHGASKIRLINREYKLHKLIEQHLVFWCMAHGASSESPNRSLKQLF